MDKELSNHDTSMFDVNYYFKEFSVFLTLFPELCKIKGLK